MLIWPLLHLLVKLLILDCLIVAGYKATKLFLSQVDPVDVV
jgi:hypothetical protein